MDRGRYVCNICKVPGHDIKDCPDREVRAGGQGPGREPKRGTRGTQEGPSAGGSEQGQGHGAVAVAKDTGKGTGNNAKGTQQQTKKRRKKKAMPDGYVCNLCGIEGHYIKDCPRKKAAGDGDVVPLGYTCNICNESGHFLKDCPKKGEAEARRKAARPHCQFFLKGSCHKGEACPFAHPEGKQLFSRVLPCSVGAARGTAHASIALDYRTPPCKEVYVNADGVHITVPFVLHVALRMLPSPSLPRVVLPPVICHCSRLPHTAMQRSVC